MTFKASRITYTVSEEKVTAILVFLHKRTNGTILFSLKKDILMVAPPLQQCLAFYINKLLHVSNF